MKSFSILFYSCFSDCFWFCRVRHFGKEVLKKELKWEESKDPDQIQRFEMIYNKLYEEFIEAIDGYDNGIDGYPPEIIPQFKQTTHIT